MTTEANNTEQAAEDIKTLGKIIELPSGRKAEMQKSKGRQIREAQRIAGGDSELIMFALISLTTTIDGQPVTVEDLDEMDGTEVMKLMAEFGSNF